MGLMNMLLKGSVTALIPPVMGLTKELTMPNMLLPMPPNMLPNMPPPPDP
jgi:hypothetical protein